MQTDPPYHEVETHLAGVPGTSYACCNCPKILPTREAMVVHLAVEHGIRKAEGLQPRA